MACPVAHIIVAELLPYIVVAILTPIVLFAYCCYRCCRKKRVQKAVMPGPFQLPIVGCLPFVNREGLHLTFSKWARRFGAVFSCRLGRQTCVVLSDATLIREALANGVFSDRPDMYLFTLGRDPREPESKGIIMNDGESWKQQRRFLLHNFRNFGIGKTSFEDVISTECDHLTEELAKERGEPFDIRMHLNAAVANVIATVLFGKDFTHSDREFARFVDHVANAAENIGGSALLNFFPFLRHFPHFRTAHQKLYDGMVFNFGVLRAIVDQEKKTFNERDIRNYTAAFLARQKATAKTGEVPTAEDGRLFTDHHLVMSLSDIFSAGFETTATTLRWALLYVILDPELQRTIQAEIDRAIQPGQSVHYSDREKLPWTEAALLEVARIATIAPLGVPHAVSEEVALGGFVIPRGSTVFTNLYHVHHNPENFPDPETFKPERFLDETRTRIIGTENLMPFSVGKRVCPGEALAKMELLLFFVTLLQRYNFKLPDGHAVQGIATPRCGLTNDTRPFQLIAEPRGNPHR